MPARNKRNKLYFATIILLESMLLLSCASTKSEITATNELPATKTRETVSPTQSPEVSQTPEPTPAPTPAPTQTTSSSHSNKDKDKIMYPVLMQLFIELTENTLPQDLEKWCDDKGLYYHNFNYIDSGGTNKDYTYRISEFEDVANDNRKSDEDYMKVFFRTDDGVKYWISEAEFNRAQKYVKYRNDFCSATHLFDREYVKEWTQPKEILTIYAYRMALGADSMEKCNTAEEAIQLVLFQRILKN